MEKRNYYLLILGMISAILFVFTIINNSSKIIFFLILLPFFILTLLVFCFFIVIPFWRILKEFPKLKNSIKISLVVLIITNLSIIVTLINNNWNFGYLIGIFIIEVIIVVILNFFKILILKNEKFSSKISYSLTYLFISLSLITFLFTFLVGKDTGGNIQFYKLKDLLLFWKFGLIFLLSHSFSLIFNYIRNKENEKAKLNNILFGPLILIGIIFISCFSILGGIIIAGVLELAFVHSASMITDFSGNRIILIILSLTFLLIKTGIDSFRHISERNKLE